MHDDAANAGPDLLSVDADGIDRLVAGAMRMLQRAGLGAGGPEPDCRAALYALALRIAIAEDGTDAAAEFLGAALPLLARGPDQQLLLINHFRGGEAVDAVSAIFGRSVAPRRLAPAMPEEDNPVATPGTGKGEQTADGRVEDADSDKATARPGQPSLSWLQRLAAWLSRLRDAWSTKERLARLVRKRVSDAARQISLTLPAVHRAARAGGLRSAAAKAAVRLERPSRRLNEPRTIKSTLARAGLLSPVWRIRRDPVEYLLLVRQLSDTDLEYDRISAYVREFREHGVLIDLYPYRSDPREVTDTLSGEAGSIGLQQLYQRHPAARLVIVSEGRELVHPFTLAPVEWARALAFWPRRALVTPLPSADWGTVEGRIHRELGFSLASSREQGLENLQTLLGGSGPVVIRSPDPGLAMTPLFVAGPSLQHVDDSAPSPTEQRALILQLRQHLGPVGYRWLGVCAFFPAMTAPIALYFGQRLLATPAQRADLGTLFARLSGLPWMRFGHIPYWLRQLVIAGLSETEKGSAREIAASIMQSSNLSPETPHGRIDAGATALSGAPLVLPVRVEQQPSDNGLLIDALTIELLAGGTSQEIDPIMQLTEQALRGVLEPEPPTQPVESPAAEDSNKSDEKADATQNQAAPSALTPEAKLKVFISYAREDGAFVDRLTEALTRHGDIELVIDRTHIQAAEDWRRRLEALLAEADAVVFVLSPTATRSHSIRWEVDRAVEQSKRLLPIIWVPIEGDRVPDALARLHSLRFDGDNPFEVGVEALRRALLTDVHWMREHTRLLLLAREWDAAGRARRRLLQGPDVADARAWLSRRPASAQLPPTVVLDFIAAAEQLEFGKPSAGDAEGQYETRSRGVRIFLSYSQRDRRLAEPLAQDLQRAGHSVWFDQKIEVGAPFEDAIRQELNSAEVVIVIWTAESVKSAWVRDEARYAQVRSKLLPIHARDLDLGDLPLGFGHIQTAALDDRAAILSAVQQIAGVEQKHAEDTGKLFICYRRSDTEPDAKRLFDALARRIGRDRLFMDAHQIRPGTDFRDVLRREVNRVSAMAVLIGPEWASSANRDGFRLRNPDDFVRVEVAQALSREIPVVPVLIGGARLPSRSELPEDLVSLLDYQALQMRSASGADLDAVVDALTALIEGTPGARSTNRTGRPRANRERTAAEERERPRSAPLTLLPLAICEGHTDFVGSARFDPNGSKIVSGSKDCTVRVWGVDTGTELLVLPQHPDEVRDALFIGNEQIATACDDGLIRVWDATRGEEIKRMSGHRNVICSLAMHPARARLVSASWDRTVKLWDLANGQVIWTSTGHTANVWSVAVNLEGDAVASASDDRTIRLWDLSTGRERQRLAGHIGGAICVAFSADGRRLASGARDGGVIVWDAQTGAKIADLSGHTEMVTSIAYSNNGALIATASDDETVRLWDAVNFDSVAEFTDHAGIVNCVRFSPSDNAIVTASHDRTVRITHVQRRQA